MVICALALQVRRPSFQAHHVRLLQLQFGGVFAGHHPLGGVDVGGEAVQERSLA